MPTEGYRSLVYIVEIVFIFLFLYLFDIKFIKSGVLFYGIMIMGLAIASVLGYLLVKNVEKYFNY